MKTEQRNTNPISFHFASKQKNALADFSAKALILLVAGAGFSYALCATLNLRKAMLCFGLNKRFKMTAPTYNQKTLPP
jgi:hypothetical protein